MSGLDAAQPADRTPPLWRNFSFHVLWSSTFASGFGDRMAMVAAMAMLGYAGEQADNSSIQSGVDFFFFLPYVLWAPLAGWLTDRLPRKWVLFTADQLRGLFVLFAVTLIPAGAVRAAPEDEWMVWGMIMAIGVAAATFVPAKLSVVPGVAGYGALTRANAAVVCMGIAGNAIGFILGGDLAARSVQMVVLVSAGCYMISGLLWAFLKTPWEKKAGGPRTGSGNEAAQTGPIHVFREIADGMRYAWQHAPVRVLIGVAALVWGGTSIYLPALAVVNVELYGGEIGSLGLLMGCVGAGILVGSIAMGLVNTRFGAELFITLGMLGCGLFIGLQMIVPWKQLGVAIALATGLSAGLLLVPLNTLLQRITADHIRGRVFAAKEILAEAGKVVIAGLIWQVPDTDPAMRPLGGAMAVGLVAVAVYGAGRHVMRGAAPTRGTNLLWRIARFHAEAVHRLRTVGRHRVPRAGPVLLVSNHTAGVDPLLIQAAVPRIIRWMMAREYLLRPLGFLWRAIRPIPVRRDAQDPAAAREAIRALRSGSVIGIFPQGGIHRDGDRFGGFREGLGMIGRQGGATIVPVYVDGTPRTSGVIRSFFLPSRSRVVFGPPFRAADVEGGRQAVADEARRRIEQLAAEAEA